jgi:ubiquitin carboxyl-terminal hydrolase MINDY-1/2
MDLNPLFTGVKSFRPSGTAGEELKLFEQADIPLVHGWLVDPESPEAEVITKLEDYDSAVNLVVEADHLSKGRLVLDDSDIPQTSLGGSSSQAGLGSPSLSNEERKTIEDGAFRPQT